MNGTVPVNRHVLETAEQQRDYKEAGPSICVPSFLSAGVPLSRRFCLLSCEDYQTLVLKTTKGCVNQKSQHLHYISANGTDLRH